jgi:hypothetical protein
MQVKGLECATFDVYQQQQHLETTSERTLQHNNPHNKLSKL